MYRLFLICALGALMSASAFAQLTSFYLNDFESGLGDITDIAPGETARYDIADVSVVSSSASFPAAFPPPSGSNALRLADDDNNFFGLASGTSAFYVSTETVTAMRVSADIYIRPSAGNSDNFFALIALNDTDAPNAPGIERYWRLGFRDTGSAAGGLVLQTFDGGSFTVEGNDSPLALSLASPEWHTLSLEFDFTPTVASGSVNAYVDGVPASFNPIPYSAQPLLGWISAGGLAFDFSEQEPMFVDNLEMATDNPGTIPVELSTFTTE